jgi:hypothetical protein
MSLNIHESMIVQLAIDEYMERLSEIGIFLRVRRNFDSYAAIRHAHGDHHLNQAFDPRHMQAGDHDFWLLAESRRGAAIATYCLRRFVVDDFYSLIRSQALWFGEGPRLVDPRFVVDCEIPPFGGEVVHAGGLWVRPDYRGAARRPRLSTAMSRLACAIALRNRPFDHDSAMLQIDPGCSAGVTDDKAVALGVTAYGYARVHRFVDGWFPPEGREAVMHLCHSTRAEAVASLVAPRPSIAATSPGTVGLPGFEFAQSPFVDQHEQLVDATAVRSEGQQQARIG